MSSSPGLILYVCVVLREQNVADVVRDVATAIKMHEKGYTTAEVAERLADREASQSASSCNPST